LFKREGICCFSHKLEHMTLCIQCPAMRLSVAIDIRTGCPISTQGILQLTVSAKSRSYSTFPMASTRLIGMQHSNAAERNLILNPSTAYWLPPTHSPIGISEMFAMITPDGQLILSTCKYIPAGPSNLQLSLHTVRGAALFQSGRSHGNFFVRFSQLCYPFTK
jgi:hypothetical protein